MSINKHVEAIRSCPCAMTAAQAHAHAIASIDADLAHVGVGLHPYQAARSKALGVQARHREFNHALAERLKELGG